MPDAYVDLRKGADSLRSLIGGALQDGSIQKVIGGNLTALGKPAVDEAEDWVLVVRK